ncbi:MAG: PIN domain-containing protein [Candidatus Marinimicrobia bacterium]|jgi:predicted nucleic acid-binding protein|nr:PIN domain-containing protein [Candidatus Neomarinimicrobiota bacterium]MBT3675353.1 PIN domain-containing protein [Candidatus Neomarinimicrobiota bacterium]MBT3763840.1 PIN domain-containing protein [Candidatus Neomarinimicrobiota bacterium]MBT4068491.1 PIN domain-containing protein [Candidatus Neomarinimicrobiota bacterium]MBT4270127.1 PIN domain-containing protein [Candidatus Neomarinimicrobiota bacterium]
MGILIDSNIIIDCERNKLDASSLFSESLSREELFISVITVSELLHGVYRGKTSAQINQRSAFVEKIIDAIKAIDIDVQVARTHARLSSELIQSGTKIGSADTWIAATCISHGLQLCTRDLKAFSQIEGLSLYSIY